MGRPRLYKTEAERKAARARYDRQYYNENIDRIARKARKSYRKKKALKNKQQDEAGDCATNGSKPLRPKRLSRAERDVVLVNERYNQWRDSIKLTPHAHCEAVYSELVCCRDWDSAVSLSMQSLDSVDKVLQDLKDLVEGMRRYYSKAEGQLFQAASQVHVEMNEWKGGIWDIFDALTTHVEAGDAWPISLEKVHTPQYLRHLRWKESGIV
ncbi:hypothetical protein CYLTODRAFT_201552 [Cylindrobasidium torrendii FP15055 ss-10]|uniref:Uncharacterized protein n=1 Tax=Cylindrobasidium torrendii FP15055 ss-10 TaxID=1314674 RepID=A0A0D7AUK6_9AGAR|nr:hypothetical protein CYLTODRAFT_201552 [Cylindrobasidium torrendii FP15055 ss-10]